MSAPMVAASPASHTTSNAIDPWKVNRYRFRYVRYIYIYIYMTHSLYVCIAGYISLFVCEYTGAIAIYLVSYQRISFFCPSRQIDASDVRTQSRTEQRVPVNRLSCSIIQQLLLPALTLRSAPSTLTRRRVSKDYQGQCGNVVRSFPQNWALRIKGHRL